jgi:enamine deaminase RidA (YjgF/YER057c/UK114 family)
MAGVAQRLEELGITLPTPPPPAAAYVPFVRTGNLVFTAGQIAAGPDGLLAEGIVGADVDMDTAVACVMAQLQAAVGDLDSIEQIVKLTVFVASHPDFTQQHLVANGASELIGQVFGDAGRHARSAVGAPALPTNSPVEVEAIVQVRD